LHLIFFENIGKSPQFDVNRYDTPEKWEPHSAANAKDIQVHTEENTESILFKVTFFLQQGLYKFRETEKIVLYPKYSEP
jgi:hypothetical protein